MGLNRLSVSPRAANGHDPAALPTFLIRERYKPDRRVTLRRDVIRIGRNPNTEIRIESDSLSRIHAVIEVDRSGAMTVIDFGSASGTYVNDEHVIGKRPIAVGDRIGVGVATIVIEPDDAPPAGGLLLPTPEVVRGMVGDAFRPKSVFGVAALVLHVDGVRRTAWSDDTELSERLFATYPRGAAPPAEAPDSKRGTYKTLDDAAPTRVQRCSACVVKPGYSPCTVCLGTGAGSSSDMISRCPACDGGYIRCSTCDGTTRVVACSIRYVNDELVRARRAVVPAAMHGSIRPFLEARIPADGPWSKEHAFDPEPSLVGSAYRGAASVRAADEFHGFFFGDALASCLAARADLTTGLARFETATFAVPVLWTVVDERHDAYFFDPAGVLQHVQGV
jgi:hypothetical protein